MTFRAVVDPGAWGAYNGAGIWHGGSMRKSYLVVAALVTMACSSGNGSRVPAARLSVPACVAAGTQVLLDASQSKDPDGQIVRYVFSVDGEPKLISNQPQVRYTFLTPKIGTGEYLQYAVRLVVVDDDGFESQAQANLFVVHDLSVCPEGPAPTFDIVYQDDSLSDADGDLWRSDVVSWDMADGVMPLDTLVQDVVPQDLPSPPDVVGPDTSDLCPNVTGKYRVEVYCFGTLQLELDLNLKQQADCTFSDSNGVLEGTIDSGGNIKLTSPFPDLNMNDCQGLFDDPEFFDVQCSSGCTAVFISM